MLTNLTPRSYQKAIFSTSKLHNTLVVLPTGLGKTAISMMLAAFRLAQYPTSKLLFVAPTKPLVEQQYKTFKEHMMLADDELVLFTGSVAPAKRHEQWNKARCIFSTPQTIENDILSRKISLDEVSLLIIDEAHRATGEYAYVFLAQEYAKAATHQRILALTASPGTTKQGIEEVMNNLHIERVEYRRLEDSDVQPYVNTTKVVWKEVELDPHHRRIVTHLEQAYTERVVQVQRYGYLKSKDLTKTQLLMVQRQLHAQLQERKTPELLHSISLLAQALKLQHAIELAQTQTVSATYAYVQGFLVQARQGGSKGLQAIASDPQVLAALALLRECREKNNEHPKVAVLLDLVHKIQKEKCIIFTQFRDTAMYLEEQLKKLLPTTVFFGQAKKNGKGFSQKEQQRVLQEFKDGKYRCLIATSVAEEGLDIPSVDNVFFFEPIPSAIRSVQRRGRTGRHGEGQVTVLLTKKTRDEINRWVSHHKEKQMYTVLENLHTTRELKSVQQTLPTTSQNYAVVADFREKGSAVLKNLRELGCDLELKQLQVGDFVLSDEVCVEYKTANDFANSIIDNRLLLQLRSLTQYKKPVVIIEGTGNNAQVDIAALHGMLSTIAVSYHIPVLMTQTPRETAQLLLTIAKREQTDGKAFSFHSSKPLDDKTLVEYVVGSLPGIGGSLAQNLLEHFGSVQNIFSASVEELKKVPLIGNKKAEDIYRTIHLNYEDTKKSR